MTVYKFKCEGCGATQCEKVDDGYKCSYCGCVQDVIFPNAEKEDNTKTSGVEQESIITKQISHKQRNILIRLLVCLFAGYLGIHKFMEGRIFVGIIYFCTFRLFGIGLFFDIVRYIFQFASMHKNGGE